MTAQACRAMPYEAIITNTYAGTMENLHDAGGMYRAGQIRPEVERHSIDDAARAYRKWR